MSSSGFGGTRPWFHYGLRPGNTTDVKTLLPVAERLSRRFGIQRVCVVADRGMIGRETLAELEQRD